MESQMPKLAREPSDFAPQAPPSLDLETLEESQASESDDTIFSMAREPRDFAPQVPPVVTTDEGFHEELTDRREVIWEISLDGIRDSMRFFGCAVAG